MGVADPLLRAMGPPRVELVLGAVASRPLPADRLLGAEEVGLCVRELLHTSATESLLTDVPRQHESALEDCGGTTWRRQAPEPRRVDPIAAGARGNSEIVCGKPGYVPDSPIDIASQPSDQPVG